MPSLHAIHTAGVLAASRGKALVERLWLKSGRRRNTRLGEGAIARHCAA
jgi:hypothetical protein